MATLAEVEVVVRAVLAPFERDMARAMSAVQSFERQAQAGFTSSNRALGLLNTQMGGTLSILRRMQGLVGLAMGGFAGNQLVRLTSAWTDLNSRVNIAVGSVEKGAAVMQRLEAIARRTYSSLNLTVESFLGASSSLRQLGYSTKTQLDFTEALNNALVVSGAKGERAASVLNALGKAFAFGQLRGDELNSVLKIGGRVSEALAKGLGVTTNELRKMGAEGQLTTDKVIKALLSQLDTLREEADSMPATVADAFTLMGNAVMRFVGNAAQASGVTTTLANVIITIADRIKNLDLTSEGFTKTASVMSATISGLGRVVLLIVDNLGLLVRVFGIFIGMRIATSVLAMGVAFIKFASALRIATLASALFTTVMKAKHRALLFTAAGIALVTGQMDGFAAKMKEVTAAVSAMIPEGITTKMMDTLDGLGVNIDALTQDFGNLTIAEDSASSAIDDLDNVLTQQTGPLTASQKAYRDLTKAAEDRIATLRTELQLVGRAPIDVERLRFQQELLNDATDKGRTIGAAQRKEIEALAATFATLTSQLAAARIAQEVLQQRVLMFGTTMQRIIADLRSQGVDVESVQGKWLAGQIQLNERLGEARELVGDFASGLMRDLQQGVGLFDALTSAVQRLQERLLEMALDAALNRMFAAIAGSLGGGLSPGASSLVGAGLFHSGGTVGAGGPKRYVHPAYFENAPRLHGGGMAGLSSNEVPAILERGERVTPRGGGDQRVVVNQITYNQAGPDVSATTRTTPRAGGGVDIETTIVRTVDRRVEGKYGQRPSSRRWGVAS